MKKNQLTPFIIFTCLSFSYPQFLFAQYKEQNKIKNLQILFSGNHFGFDISPLSVFKASTKNLKGDKVIRSSATPGFKTGLVYGINFNKEYSLKLGAEAIIAGRNFEVNFYKDEFSPPLKKDYLLNGLKTFTGDLILGMPISIEKRFLLRKNKYIHAAAGLRMNFSTGGDFDIDQVTVENINNQYIHAAEIDKTANNDAKPWISYLVSIGRSYILGNNNILQLSLISNLSFTKYVNGTYQIDIPGKPLSEGTYSSSGAYLGVSLNYVFTNANYRLRKIYERVK